MIEPDPYALLKACKQRKDWWSAREEIERLIAAPPSGADVAYLRQQAALCFHSLSRSPIVEEIAFWRRARLRLGIDAERHGHSRYG